MAVAFGLLGGLNIGITDASLVVAAARYGTTDYWFSRPWPARRAETRLSPRPQTRRPPGR